MSAELIDGNVVAEEIINKVRTDAEEFAARTGQKPMLTAVQVGENPASRMYIKMQEKSCNDVGIDYNLVTLTEDTTEQQLLDEIKKLNNDETIR